MIDKVILENKYTFNFWQEFFIPLSWFRSLTVEILFNVCSSFIVPFSTCTFVCKINNIFQNELVAKEGEVEELGALNKFLIVKEKNVDTSLVEELLSNIERGLVLLI